MPEASLLTQPCVHDVHKLCSGVFVHKSIEVWENGTMTLPPQVLSPLDGRYQPIVVELGEYLSEAGLNRARVHVEIEWLIFLTDRSFAGSSPLSADDVARLRSVVTGFGQPEIDALARYEATTRHDVKAVEYLVRDRLSELGLDRIAELTHFACTSEDINNTSYALIIRDALTRVWIPAFRSVIDKLSALAREFSDAAMLARTHGQPATPTTMGKEFAVYAYRLTRVARHIDEAEFLAKFSGATGTF
jgi:adenylosuccinate lyase